MGYLHQSTRKVAILINAKLIIGLMIIVTTCYHPSNAQSSLKESILKLDSGFVLKSKMDSGYINKLHKIIRNFIYVQPDSLIDIIRMSIALSEKAKYKFGEVEALTLMGEAYQTSRSYDSAIFYHNRALVLANKLSNRKMISAIHNFLGTVYTSKGNYPEAISNFLSALKIAEQDGDKDRMAAVYNNLGNIYYYQRKYDDALSNYLKTREILKELKDTLSMCLAGLNIGSVYREKTEYRKAMIYLNDALLLGKNLNYPELNFAAKVELAQAYAGIDSIEAAIDLFGEVIEQANRDNDALYASQAYLGKAKALFKAGQNKMAMPLADSGLQKAKAIGQKKQIKEGHELLANMYEALGNPALALMHFKQFKMYADSLSNIESERAAADMEAEYAYSKKELQFQRKSIQQKWLIFSAFAGIVSLSIILFIINRNRRHANRANHALQLKNHEIEKQKLQLEEAFTHLKETQNQLIQAEKMASLGEITAGIAHEIQNPLNFINNFSDVSREMLDEIMDAMNAGNMKEVNDLLDDIKGNLEKIENHGKRADGIVKSMLYHSRTAIGKKELINTNELCEEYINLTYHGMRAKDKSFNAKVERFLDPEAGSIEVIPQDIGRVMLNILNNAFFAVIQRKGKEGPEYQPTIKVFTGREKEFVKIIIEDNGTGIPEEIRTKIFQPFFTTKPTGSGTGLGLSIAYDIITKGHNGTIDIETLPNVFTRFIITLPVGKLVG